MTLEDIRTAIKMRDVLTSIAENAVERLRPPERIGKVYSYNQETKSVQILFAGETVNNLVKVHCSDYLIPRVTMDATFNTLGYDAPADIVRVAYGAGQYYVCDYISGAPKLATVSDFSSATISTTTLNVEGRRIRGDMYLGHVHGLMSAITNVPNDGAQRGVYGTSQFSIPTGTRLALVSISGGGQCDANAACHWTGYYQLNGAGWAERMYRMNHNNNRPAYSMEFAGTFGVPIASNVTTLAVAVNCSVDAASGSWLWVNPGQVEITYLG